MTSLLKTVSKPLGLVWLECPRSVVVAGLVRALEEHATVYVGTKRPEGISCIMICAREEEEELSERIKQFEDTSAHSAPNLPLARDALRAGASGFVHAGMTPDQLVRAVSVAIRGETVAPRQLLGYLLDQDEPANLGALSARQREILGYVAEGLSNAEIASALFLSESTIKQHLRAAYKLIGASNRTEAAKLFRRDG